MQTVRIEFNDTQDFLSQVARAWNDNIGTAITGISSGLISGDSDKKYVELELTKTA